MKTLNRFSTLALGSLLVLACGDDTTEGDDTNGTTTGTPTTESGVTLTTTQTTGPTTDPTDPDTTTGDDDPTAEEDTTTGETTGEEETDGTTGEVSDCVQIDVTNLLVTGLGRVYQTLGVEPNIGGADPDLFRIELYTPDTGVIDLGTGNNENYADCDQCVRLFEDVTGEGIARQYYQQSGTIEIDASSDPFEGVLIATLSNVVLVEVTIGEGFVSTPVRDGLCVELNTPQQFDVAPINSCAAEAQLCGSEDAVPGSYPLCFCDEACAANDDCCPDICEQGVCDDEPFCDD